MARRVTLVAWGSRGDVAPIITLGQGLRATGDEVSVLASRDFESSVRAAGLHWLPFDISVMAAARSPSGRQWLGGHRTLIGEGLALQKVLDTFAQPLVEGLWTHTREADLVVSGILTADACASLTAARDQDHAVALFTPVLPSRQGASSPTALVQSRDTALNALTGRAVLGASYRLLRVPGDTIRQRLGHRRTRPGWLLDRLRHMPVLVGTSRYVVPPDPNQPNVTVTGYWPPAGQDLASDEAERLEALIAAERARGRPVVSLGFGSMTTTDPVGTADLLIRSAQDAGVHPIIGDGWTGVGAYLRGRKDVTVIEHVPHDWLFAHCDAVVHHGGAGTTGSAFRSGVPQVVVAHMGDQFFWAHRAHQLGVASAPLRRAGLTHHRLTGALAEVTAGPQAELRSERARELAGWVGSEDGVAAGVDLLRHKVGPSPT
ncbi:MAG: glycosyltransferase [Ornithinimicrobium sp.]